MAKPGRPPITWTLDKIMAHSTPEKDTDCLIWKGPWHRQGYAYMRQSARMRTVHSVIHELKTGDNAPGKSSKEKITRTCKNLACVNPEHIVLKNMTDVMKSAKQGNGCMFSSEDIRQIRKDLEKEFIRDEDGNPVLNKNGKIKKTVGYHRKLAKKWGGGHQHMWMICNNYRYRWVKEEN